MEDMRAARKLISRPISKKSVSALFGIFLFLTTILMLYPPSTYPTTFHKDGPTDTTPVGKYELKTKSWVAGDDKANAKIPYQSKKENALIVQTNSGLRKIIILKESRVSIDLPFTSYSAEVRVETQPDVVSVSMNHLSQRLTTYVLGLGNNILDIRLSYHERVNNSITVEIPYLITLNRQHRLIIYTSGVKDEECYLEQDCDLILNANRKCGAQAMKYWSPSPKMQGYWKMRCNNCSLEQTCLWSKAEWIETDNTAILPPLPNTDSLRTCLRDHQVLFLGDSTLREMMHTLVEKVNTTLYHVEKTHDLHSYNNVGLATNFTFTYFPTFWNKNPPSLRETLDDLATHSPTEGKQNRTILAVGGLQWLRNSNVQEIHSFITEKGIRPNNVYIKLYGSGFIVKTDFTHHFHSQDSIQKLLQRNNELRKQAKKHNFRVIDTLQMTLSRYKEFHQGVCACHFHQVDEHQLGTSTNHSWVRLVLEKIKLKEKLSPLTIYHIDGDIHNSYTNMLISQMCKDHMLD